MEMQVRPPISDRPLRAGVVGLGFGRYHAATLAAIPGVELVGLAQRHETNPSKREFADHYGVRVFESLPDLLNAEAPDLVVIASRPSTHLQLAEDAIAAGAAVLIEKPLAGTISDVRCLARLAADPGVWLAVNFEMRYLGAVQELRRILGDGVLGDLQLASLHYVMDSVPSDSWIWSPAEGGSPLIENSVHAFDLVRYLFGDAEVGSSFAVNALGAGKPAPDAAQANLQTRSGVRVSLTVGAINAPALEVPMRLQVYGTHGQAILDGSFHAFTHLRWARHTDSEPTTFTGSEGSSTEPEEFGQAPLLVPGLRQVVTDLQRGLAPDADAEAALVAQLLADQVSRT